MSKVWTAAGLAVALAATSACFGKSAAQKQQEEAAKQMEDAAKKMEEASKGGAKAAEGMAAGMEALAKGLGAAAAAANGGKVVEPVSFRDLQATFVPISGWEMEKPTGERMTAPFAISQAEVRYTKGDDSNIRVKIVDSAYNTLMLVPFSWVTNMGYEKDTGHGFEKATKIAGFPALEKWDSEGKDGEVTIVANKRYIVEVEGRNVDDVKVLTSLAESMTFNKLPTQ
jgi:hypothetical protein